MACACKVNEEINKIQKYYSYNSKERDKKKAKMTINKKDAAETMFIYLLLVPFLPLMFIGLLFYGLFSKNKRISTEKLLSFIHNIRNGKQQQII